MIPIVLPGMLGLATGLIVNYLADVLPVTRKFSRPACRNCQAEFTWKDYILLNPCRACGSRHPARRIVVLIACIVGTVFLWQHPASRLGFLFSWLIAAYLVLVAVIDLEYRLILHPISLAGAVIAGIAGIQLHGIWLTFLGGLAGFGIMLSLYYLGDVFARWLARRRGQELEEVALGFGDVILSGVLGLLLGWPGITAALVLGILIGGVASVLFLLSRVISRSYQPFTAIPYAPFLILGAGILIFRF